MERRLTAQRVSIVTCVAVGCASMASLTMCVTGRWPWAIVVVGCWAWLACLALRADLRAGRAKSRLERGECPECGYDLRATPARCPECGWDRE
jgi:hypothetical protein